MGDQSQELGRISNINFMWFEGWEIIKKGTTSRNGKRRFKSEDVKFGRGNKQENNGVNLLQK